MEFTVVQHPFPQESDEGWCQWVIFTVLPVYFGLLETEDWVTEGYMACKKYPCQLFHRRFWWNSWRKPTDKQPNQIYLKNG